MRTLFISIPVFVVAAVTAGCAQIAPGIHDLHGRRPRGADRHVPRRRLGDQHQPMR